MANAIGMIELTSIARGVDVCDSMVKAAQVDIIRTSTVCPGKYMVIICGNTGEVTAAMKRGTDIGAECIVDTLLIPNANNQLLPAINQTTQVTERGALGVIEFFSVASAIRAADVAAKAANITLIEVKTGFAIGGKGVVVLTGEIGAVRAAVEAAKSEAELLVGVTIIPKPDKKLFDSML